MSVEDLRPGDRILVLRPALVEEVLPALPLVLAVEPMGLAAVSVTVEGRRDPVLLPMCTNVVVERLAPPAPSRTV